MTGDLERRIHITRVKKAGLALLSKKISLGDDGSLLSDGSPCAMSNGAATRVSLDWWAPATDLAALISDLGPHEALILGDHGAESDAIEIVKAGQADPERGCHGRTLETFKFKAGCPAPALLDFDRKAISDSARARLDECGGFEGALASLIPGYSGLARVIRASTSAGIHNTETGEAFPGSGGQHVYLFVKDGADIARFLRDLQRRAWLAGLGWIMVSTRGAFLTRSIVDVTVGSPERLVFEGPPFVVAPLEQDHDARRPIAHEGEFIDTATACPPLAPEEERRCSELVEAAKREKQPEVEIAKEQAAETIAKLRSIPIEKGRAVIAASTEGKLTSWDVLQFDDEAIGEVSVADVLADPVRFHGETLADPLEGRSYGRGKAMVFWNANNSVVVNSFAHGGCVYAVHHDPDYIEQVVEDAGDDAPYVLARLMVHAGKIDAVAKERLRNLAAKIAGAGKIAVKKVVDETAREAKRSAAAAARARGTRSSGSSRGTAARASTRTEMPLIGGQRPAQLRVIEANLRMASNVVPGAVVARGQTTAVIRCACDPVKLRAGRHEINLPAGSAYLAVAKPEHLQAQLDALFEFTRTFKNGEVAVVDAPADLARYVLANANLLPVQSISRTPILRHDGSIVSEPGYDSSTGILYAPDETFPPVPDEPSQNDACAALKRLRCPFRGFPFVTDTDRDAVVGELLTLTTRHLMPRAPAFAHTAVEAGSGKTKLFDTVALIAIGTNAPLLNAEILDDETELRKCLTTLTLAAAPIVVFDNVIRGGQITSPGLSNYLTATVYGDRLLGSNTEVKAATCTVIGMTGNAVEVAGDNVRRVLRVDLDAGVERPETREFDFDCEAEARQDRGELVVAALTLLRAHALAGWPPVPGRAALGSFEDWDRLVAGAIVYAGGADIVTLLAKTRLADPERDDLAEVLKMLEGIGATTPMKVGEIIHAVETQKIAGSNIFDPNRPADAWHAVLCRLSRNGQPNARKIGRHLSKNAGRIAGGLQLTMTIDNHEKANRYSVRPVTNARVDEAAAGFAGFCGLSRPPFQSDAILSRDHESDEYIKYRYNEGTETPRNPRNPANGSSPHPNGHEGGPGDCAHCRITILPGTPFTATSTGEHLHYACVDAWATSTEAAPS